MAVVYALHAAQDASLKLEFGFFLFAKHCLWYISAYVWVVIILSYILQSQL